MQGFLVNFQNSKNGHVILTMRRLFFPITIGCDLLFSQSSGIFQKEKNGGIKQMH